MHVCRIQRIEEREYDVLGVEYIEQRRECIDSAATAFSVRAKESELLNEHS